MGKDVFEMIRHFGKRKKLFAIHFRNVSGPLPRFFETFPDDGYQDMPKVMRTLRSVGFNGTVIARSGGGSREMFTVRRIVAGEGVERKFPVHSPRIDKIEVKRSSVVRRAKLYYLRDRVGKAVRLKERRRK